MNDESVPPLPEIIRSLDPDIIDPWRGVSDDVIRQRKIESASDDELRRLVEAVNRDVLMAIDHYLDQFHGDDPEPIVWLHDVAQAALEAAIELDERR